MLAISRTLMARPRLLLLDESSTGLAPLVTKQIFEINKEQNTTVFLVEQNANLTLQVADRGYVLKNGWIVMQDTAAALTSNHSMNSLSRHLRAALRNLHSGLPGKQIHERQS